MAAPICATSLTGPSRSRRAISESCRLDGIASAGNGPERMYCPFSSRSRLPSSSVLVSSSIQSGMPSVCSMIRSRISPGSVLPPATRSDQCLCFPLPETAQCHGGHLRLAGPGRLELRAECHDHEHRQPADALGDPIQQIERGRDRLQCASSNRNSTGRCCARSSNCRTSAAKIRSRFCRGSSGSGG